MPGLVGRGKESGIVRNAQQPRNSWKCRDGQRYRVDRTKNSDSAKFCGGAQLAIELVFTSAPRMFLQGQPWSRKVNRATSASPGKDIADYELYQYRMVQSARNARSCRREDVEPHQGSAQRRILKSAIRHLLHPHLPRLPALLCIDDQQTIRQWAGIHRTQP